MAFDVNKLDLESVQLFKSSVVIDEEHLNKGFEIDNYGFSFHLSSGFSLELKKVDVTLQILIQAKEKDKELKVNGEFRTKFRFNYNELEQFVPAQEEN